jgi:hypothetical protein
LWWPHFFVAASLSRGDLAFLAFLWRPRRPRFVMATSLTSLYCGGLTFLWRLRFPRFLVATSLTSLSCGGLLLLWRPPFIVAASRPRFVVVASSIAALMMLEFRTPRLGSPQQRDTRSLSSLCERTLKTTELLSSVNQKCQPKRMPLTGPRLFAR